MTTRSSTSRTLITSLSIAGLLALTSVGSAIAQTAGTPKPGAAATPAGSGARATATPTAVVKSDCADCGTVASVTPRKTKGKATWVGTAGGAVAGGLLGNQVGGGTGKTIATVGGAAAGAVAGREIEKRTNKKEVFDIVINMDNGSVKTITKDVRPALQAGNKVKVTGDEVFVR
jgi:outer membrane lipoprotein SlyB